MSFVNEVINREFFIIDSDNVGTVKTQLYGYVIEDEGIVSETSKVKELEGIGSYIYIDADGEEITIHQDFIGSYCIYLYCEEDYFALSNSFLKLVEYLKDNHELSFNQDYANAFMLPRLLTSFSFGQTLVNEIECLDRNITLRISKENLTLELLETDFGENTVDVDSIEGLEILDNWFEKWVNIIRAVKMKTNRFNFDLSGGFDTRVAFTLLASSNIDLNSINVFSIDDDKHNHQEDLEIANQIADEFGFRLNQKDIYADKVILDDKSEIIALSSYVKLGFCNQFNYKTFYSPNPVFTVNGFAGGCIRGFPNGTIEGYKNKMLKTAKSYNPSFEPSVDRILSDGIGKVSEICDNDPQKLNWRYYKETRLRYHFGKSRVESFLVNRITLSPLIDPDLYRLNLTTRDCDDKQLLITLILYRYCPKLLDFKVEGGRKFNSETIEHAKRINDIKPYVHKSYEMIGEVEEQYNNEVASNDKDELAKDDIEDYVKDIFTSEGFVHDFNRYIPPIVYKRIMDSTRTHNFLPTRDIFPAISIVKIRKYLEYFRAGNYTGWLDSYFSENVADNMDYMTKALLKKYAMARIDIKNKKNESNSVEILDISDSNCKVESPKWLRNKEGKGKIIKSTKGSLDFKLKCINEGNLNIRLRGIKASDKNGNDFPIYIDFTKFIINGTEILDESRLVCHDRPYAYSKEVGDGETIDIHIEWLPFNENSAYESEIDSLKERLKKSEQKNRDLEKKLEADNSSRSKLISKLKIR